MLGLVFIALLYEHTNHENPQVIPKQLELKVQITFL